MLQVHNTTTTGLPYGMSNVTNPAWIQAAQFLYAQYPGIYKLRIKRVCRGSKAVQIRVISCGEPRRQKRCKGYSLASAMANLLQAIKHDKDLSRRLTHPEPFPPQIVKSLHDYAENIV